MDSSLPDLPDLPVSLNSLTAILNSLISLACDWLTETQHGVGVQALGHVAVAWRAESPGADGGEGGVVESRLRSDDAIAACSREPRQFDFDDDDAVAAGVGRICGRRDRHQLRYRR